VDVLFLAAVDLRRLDGLDEIDRLRDPRLELGESLLVSSCLGTSAPARRATAPLAVSQAICTWRFIGSMSG